MTTRTTLLRALETIGEEPVPDPAPGFVVELEHRLLHDIESSPVARLVGAEDAVRRSTARRSLTTLSGVAAALVLVVGIVMATVQQGTTRVATPAAPPPSASPSDDDPGDAEDEPTPSSDENPAGDDTDGDGAQTGGGTRDDREAGADATEPAGSADRGSTAETAPPVAAWRYAEPSEERFALEAEGTATGADLGWEPYRGDDFFAYVVLRAYESDPEYPRSGDGGARTRFVHRTESRDDTTWSDTNLRLDGEYRYLVVVFDRSGRELARSNVAAVNASVGINITNLL